MFLSYICVSLSKSQWTNPRVRIKNKSCSGEEPPSTCFTWTHPTVGSPAAFPNGFNPRIRPLGQRGSLLRFCFCGEVCPQDSPGESQTSSPLCGNRWVPLFVSHTDAKAPIFQ